MRKIVILAILLLIGYYLLRNFTGIQPFGEVTYRDQFIASPGRVQMAKPRSPQSAMIGKSAPEFSPSAPNAPTRDRIIIKNGSMSLVVKDVLDSRTKITQEVEKAGGYVVSSDISQPQETPTANVTLRIPAQKFDQILGTIRSLGLKVTSENINSQDVTDEYIDLEGRLKSAEATKQQFLTILNKAVTVEDILKVQTELNRIQTEIEQTKGRMEYLSKSGQFALLTVYLAVDEGELPYLPPSEKWRPDVAFKTALRSLLGTLKDLSYSLIWLLVYSIIIVPTIFVLLFLKRRFWK